MTFWRLLSEQGSARNALAALPDIASAAGITNYEPCPEAVALAELRAGRKAGARPVWCGEAGYPALLAQIADAPPLLWIRGDIAVAARPAVALVGARNASSLGLRMARKLAADLSAAGLLVVSGLARGIDTAAHQASADGGTAAVLAGGIDTVFPAENEALAARIAETGLLVSEQPPGISPQSRHFPQRNRIISGMSRAVLVVEAALQSGSLITARTALDQGRDVMAVPGHPFDGRAAGCNLLLRDGATLIRGAEDVLAALSGRVEDDPAAPQRSIRPAVQPAAPPTAATTLRTAPPRPIRSAGAAPGAPDVRSLRDRILDCLGPSPLAEDLLLRDLALGPAEIAEDLVALEMDGLVLRDRSGGLSRA